MRRLLLPLLLASTATAQTPPVKPQTPDVPVFPDFSIPSVPSTIGTEPLTADEAVRVAIANQPELRTQRDQWIAAEGRAEQARAGLLPRLTLSYSETSQSVFKGQALSNGTNGLGLRANGAIAVSQLLYDFGRTRAFARQQGSLAVAAQWQYRQAVSNTSLSVRRSFYGLARAIELQKSADANLKNRNAQLALADARLKSGLGAPSDFLNAKNAVANATNALTLARGATVTARIALALALGVDPRTPITLADSDEAEPKGDLGDLIDAALTNRPEFNGARADVDAQKHGLALAHRTNAPTISLTASFNSRGTNDPFLNQSSNLGIVFSWPVGDVGLTSGSIKQAKANLDASRSNLKGLTQSITGEVVQASIDEQSAAQRLETAQAQLANAKELVRVATGRYQGGIGLFTDVIAAQDALFQAEGNVSTARADLQVARAALRRAIGGDSLPDSAF